MQWTVVFLMLLAAQTGGEASVLHWTTRLLHMNCDNRPVSHSHDPVGLIPRIVTSDLVTPMQFEAERPMVEGGTLTLGICNGEVHVLAATDAAKLKVVVRLGASLGRERTPKDYLQEFSLNPSGADIEWKLPRRALPVIDVYVPKDTKLNLELGNVQLEVRGVRGDKQIDAGRGTARLYVMADGADYRRLTVDVAMGSFVDLRPGGKQSHKVPLHEEFSGTGKGNAHLSVAMGKAEIAYE
jgi:hypothetical protein